MNEGKERIKIPRAPEWFSGNCMSNINNSVKVQESSGMKRSRIASSSPVAGVTMVTSVGICVTAPVTLSDGGEPW